MKKIPDIFTHIMIGLSIGLIIEREYNHESFLMLALGSIIIDIERPFVWVIDWLNLPLYGLTSGFHSILGALVLCYVVTNLFHGDGIELRNRYVLLLIGAVSHLILDMTMYPWEERGIFLLYPIRIAFSFNLFWTDYFLYPLYGIITLGIAFALHKIRESMLNHRDDTFSKNH
ncbi:MAG: metal-dependent hydrolase [Candidatus Thorarchaeota archaeon]